jgi:mono/diheme cytochrome c family protein
MCCVRIVALLALLGSAVKAQAPVRTQEGTAVESTVGPVLYKTHCAVCHGTDGKGGGPLARYLRTAPPDLTRLTARNNGTFPLARIQKLIAGEEELPAGHGTRLMPVWGPLFSQVDWDRDLGRVRIYNLAKFIATMQK